MDDSSSAKIILFPSRGGMAPPPASVPPTERLSAALSALSAALAEQQQAIQSWREAMTDLANCMRALGAKAGSTAAAKRSL